MPFTEEGRRLTNEFVRTLSNHLRYTLQDKTAVPLKEELKYVWKFSGDDRTAVSRLSELGNPCGWEMQECFCFSIILLMFRKYHQAQHDHGRAPCPYHRQPCGAGLWWKIWFSLILTPAVVILKRIWNTWTGQFPSRFMTLMEKSEPTICSNGFILFMEKKPMRIFPTNPDGVQDQRLRFHTFHTGRMQSAGKQKLKHRNLFFTCFRHTSGPGKRNRAKACLKKAFGLLL